MPFVKCDDRENPDEQIPQKCDQRRISRHIEVVEASSVADENSNNADGDTEVPESGTGGDQDRLGEQSSAEAAEKPNCNGEPELDSGAKKKRSRPDWN